MYQTYLNPRVFVATTLLFLCAPALVAAQPCADASARACWPGDGDALDIVGTTHGTLHGDATFAAGKVGQAFSFDGDGDWVSFGDGTETALDFTSGDFTFNLWVNFNTLAGEQVIMEKFTGSTTPGWTLTKLIGNDLLFWGCGGTTCIQYPSGFTAGTWHHVAVTRSGTVYTLYVDGVALLSGPNSNPIPPSTNPLIIGRRNAADGRGFFVNGRIDEIQIFSEALSAEEIGEIVAAGDNSPPTVDAGGPYSGDEGSPISLSGATAFDPDSDPLTYAWSVDNPTLCTFSDDTVLAPDLTCVDNGSFTVTLTVDDGTHASVSSDATVTVANVAPTVVDLTVPGDPVNLNDQAASSVDVTFSDPAGVHDEAYTCDFDLDGDGTSDATVSGVTGTTCSANLDYDAAGVYSVEVTVTDKDGGAGEAQAVTYVVIYDPSDGFVTGGGWIDSPPGACPDFCADATGKATFGFVSKYKKGASVPTGQTQFQFKAGDLNFHSSSYDWLVIAGAKAMYKGTGTINGSGEYSFQINAIDGDVTGGGDVDRFRIKIKEPGGGVVYDNQPGAGDNDDPTTVLGGGSIKIHQSAAGKRMAEGDAAAGDRVQALPETFALYQSYPNPFNPATTIPFDVTEKTFVRLKIYDMTGREVRTLVSGEMAPGRHRAVFSAETLPSGAYYYRIEMGGFSDMKKMVLVK